MSPLYKIMLLFIVSLAIAQPSRAKQNYKNFKLAIYCPARDVQRMADLNWLEKNFNLLDKYLDIDKVYLETYRGQTLVDKETISKAKNFFKERAKLSNRQLMMAREYLAVIYEICKFS